MQYSGSNPGCQHNKKEKKMNNTEFMIEVENSHNRSKRVLLKKEKEYAGEKNRLEQFYRVSEMNQVNPCEALNGMSSKHITSIADMVKDPYGYSLKKWNEKLIDLRNYTYLLDALLRDMEIE
jgi:hypothetical protein